MTKTPSQSFTSSQFVEIPVAAVKVATRLRGTSQAKVLELAASVRGIGLLHPITVVERGDKYVLLSGNHRLECFKHLGRETVSALIKNEGDELVEQLVEVQENLAKQHGLVLHDKVINILNGHWGLFNVRRCMDYRYGVKKHETNLVFLKYD